MKLRLMALTLIFLPFCGPAPAAPVEPARLPLPIGPILKRAPDFAQWTVTVDYPKDTKAGGGAEASVAKVRPQTLVVTKTKHIYFEQATFSNSTRRETWNVRGLQINAAPGSRNLQIYDRSSFAEGSTIDPNLFTDYSHTDFPDIAWVSPKNYLTTKKTKDGEYLVFQQNTQNPAGTIVWIDLQTRLPAWVQSAEVTSTYQFGPPPRALLTLPSEIQQLLDRRSKAIKQMTTASPSF